MKSVVYTVVRALQIVCLGTLVCGGERAAAAICQVVGASNVCSATTNTYTVLPDGTNSNPTYSWTIYDNTSDAYIVGDTNLAVVEVYSGSNGSYVVQLELNSDAGLAVCSVTNSVISPPTAGALSNLTLCVGQDATFTTTVSGEGPFTFVWSKDGNVITNTATNFLTIANITLADSGSYRVEVSAACGSLTNDATLLVIPPPEITCAPDIGVQCLGDVPAPDTNSVIATNAIQVIYVGDIAATNGCQILITRTYAAINSCSNTSFCDQIITVTDTNPPVILSVSNRVVECGTNWDFDVPTAVDACDGTNVTISFETVTNAPLCSNTYSATRTWTATDGCSNSASCSQMITVVDTVPPVIICMSNRVVECGDAWDFDAPSATDVCDGTNVTITIFSTVTNQIVGQTFSATRTWQATDSCSNSASCSQTITNVDRTPPQIFCSTNVTVECTGPAGTLAFFTSTALDGCDTNVPVVCVPASGAPFPLGTTTVYCIATDDTGNTNTCTFTVTVKDTTPPQITCQANIIAAEAPRDSGGAAVSFSPPVASDICDSALQLISSVPSGYVFPVGSTNVTWTAIDASGNSNFCSFNVRVIPYRLFVVTNTDDAGPGSLRQAILDSNDSPDENRIEFNLTGAGSHTIHLLSALPPVTSPTIVDGWSLAGSNAPPVIELDGGGGSNAFDGLVISVGSSTVRGLALYGFATAIRLETNGNNVIQGNFIGVDSTGTNTPGNSGDGISVSSAGNLIGGTESGEGNVISGNGQNGIHFGTGASNNGVLGNSIAFNGQNGVGLDSSAGSGNSIWRNSIRSNTALGIDLGDDGVTPNDSDDTDAGPNKLQNFPVLTDARSADGVTIVEGTLTSAHNTSYRIDFYLNDAADPSTNGEGQIHLGSLGVHVGGNGEENFSATFPLTTVFTQFVTATASDPDGNTSEFSKAVQVRTPPVLEVVPVSTNTTSGGAVTFCASASGTPPIFFQWRLNGQNISGATNACYTIPSVDVPNAGAYSVVVHNALGGSLTTQARLALSVSNAIAAGDNFADRVSLFGASGETAGSNLGATREAGEPKHAGKPGGASVWYTWSPPVTGIATIGTAGSDFDTLLGVYTGTNVTNLTVQASDEDGAGFFTSGIRFNAVKNRQYHFAIDGYNAAEGDFIFGWQLEDTSHLLPAILTQPESQAVPSNAPVTFTVVATRVCGLGVKNCPDPDHYPHDQFPNMSVQWFFKTNSMPGIGYPIPGAINYSLTISNVLLANVGLYTAQVTAWYQGDSLLRTVESQSADLQINGTGPSFQNIQARDKLADALQDTPWLIGIITANTSSSQNSPGQFQIAAGASTVVSGFTGTQIFSTGSGTTSAAEDPICGVLGGASEWITLVPSESGFLFLNTDGSTYDTVMAVFLRSPTTGALQYLACDNDSGADGKDSALAIAVQAGQTNVIVVDGVNGVSGALRLNYSLASSIGLRSLGTIQGAPRLQVSGRANMNFRILVSTDMIHWSALFTTNSPEAVCDFVDASSPNSGRRFYRAQLLP